MCTCRWPWRSQALSNAAGEHVHGDCEVRMAAGAQPLDGVLRSENSARSILSLCERYDGSMAARWRPTASQEPVTPRKAPTIQMVNRVSALMMESEKSLR